MTQPTPQYTQLTIKQTHQLQYILTKTTLTLRIRTRTTTHKKSIYQHKFTSISQIDKQKILYDSFQDIVNYMRNPNHIVIQEDGHDRLVVKIVEKNNRGNVVLEFGVEFLEEVLVEDDGIAVQAIYNVCENKKDFSGAQLKEMLLMVTMGLEKLDKKIQNLSSNKDNPSRLEIQSAKKQKNVFVLNEQHDEIKQQGNPKELINKNSARSVASHADLQDIKKRISDLQFKLSLNKQFPTKFTQINKKLQKSQENIQKLQKQLQHKINKKQAENMIKKQWGIAQTTIMQQLPTILSTKITEVLKLDQINSKIKKMQRCIQELNSNNGSTIKKVDKQKFEKLKLSGQYIARQPSKWVEERCNQFKRLQIKGNVVVAKSGVNVFGKQRLQPNGLTTFSIYIANMKDYIGIGIASSKYKNDSEMGPDLIKYGSNGHLFDGKTQKHKIGKQFREGQYVTVSVDFTQGIITWKVKDEIRHQESNEKIKNSYAKSDKNEKIEWCPYILMFSPDDAIVFCFEKREK